MKKYQKKVKKYLIKPKLLSNLRKPAQDEQAS